MINTAPHKTKMDLSDPATFERVYAENERGVFAAAFRVTNNHAQAQDVVQDVFMRIWRKPDRFDPSRGEIGPFLRLMARSRALDLWREGDAASRAGDRLKVAVSQELPKDDNRPDSRFEQNELSEQLKSMVCELPQPQKEAVVLSYWGGLTADEIAKRSGVPIGTAKSRVRLGVNRLRETCPDHLKVAA